MKQVYNAKIKAERVLEKGYSMFKLLIAGNIGSFVRNFHIGFDPDYECH